MNSALVEAPRTDPAVAGLGSGFDSVHITSIWNGWGYGPWDIPLVTFFFMTL
jgi:hypothetical protein